MVAPVTWHQAGRARAGARSYAAAAATRFAVGRSRIVTWIESRQRKGSVVSRAGFVLTPHAFTVEHATLGKVDATLRLAQPADADLWEVTRGPSLTARGRPGATWAWRDDIRSITVPLGRCVITAAGAMCPRDAAPGATARRS
jgi:hypothetical protein